MTMNKSAVCWLLALALGACAGPTQRGEPTAADGCDLHYRITPRHDVQPRVLDVELRYAAGARSETFIRAEPGWAGASDYARYYGAWSTAAPHQRVTPADLPNRWRVSHRPNDTVTVRWQIRHAIESRDEGRPQDQVQLYRAQIGPDWFQFFGHAVLASVEHWDDLTRPTTCITLQPADASSVFSSFGVGARAGAAQWRITGTPQQIRHAFYAGGSGWRLMPRTLPTGTVLVAARGRFPQLADAAFADATASLIDTQRRFWGNDHAPMQAVVLTPNHLPEGNFGGTLVHQAAVLHVPDDFRIGHEGFDFLVAHENLHQWFPQRFGSRGDGGVSDVPRYWFSEGFTDFYTHRLLLTSGLWTLDRYADRLTQKIRAYVRSPARNLPADQIAPQFFSNRDAGQQMYSRGELLALRWDNALRAQGHEGMHAVLRSVMLPPDGGPRDTPLATERVLDALTPLLAPAGIDPRADVKRHVIEGESIEFDARAAAALLGPCLDQTIESVPVWTLGFDRAALDDGKLRGVDPEGPAHAAGLRDGMQAVGFSIHFGDVSREVMVQVREPAGSKVRDVSYRPVSRRSESLPRWTPSADAAASPACRRWQGR